jgi:hypothetical protein
MFIFGFWSARWITLPFYDVKVKQIQKKLAPFKYNQIFQNLAV